MRADFIPPGVWAEKGSLYIPIERYMRTKVRIYEVMRNAPPENGRAAPPSVAAQNKQFTVGG
jgi:hypothetical protein